MRFLSLDPSTSTGWAVINEQEILIDYGIIKIDSSLHLGQRLNYLHVEIGRLLDKIEPNYIAIEDVILGISGVKTLTLLSRISGVIIQQCYRKLSENVYLFTPPVWKVECKIGLKGNSTKFETLLAVCKKFNLIEAERILKIEDSISKKEEYKNNLRKKVLSTNKKINSKDVTECKTQLKKFEKELQSFYQKIEKDVCSLTGITNDISDAIAISLALKNKVLG